MGRRVSASLVMAAAVLVATAGCSNSAEPPSPPTVRFTFGDPANPDQAQVPGPGGVPTGLASSSSPYWPAGLTPEEVTAAQAALIAYLEYWSVVDSIGNNPTADWTAPVGEVATAEAGDDMLTRAQQLVADGQHAIGPTAVNPIVTGVGGGIVTLKACVDTTAADVVDETGVSVRPPDEPGARWRFLSTAQVAVFDGRWLVAVDDDGGRSTPC